MDFNLLILVIVFGGLIYMVWQMQELKKGPSNQNDKLFLEMLDNLRKELHDSSSRTRNEMSDIYKQNRQEVQTQLEKVNEKLSNSFSENVKTMQSQFKQSSDIIKDVTSKLTQLDETNKQVVSFAEQMKSLENILTNPKQRGILGEYFLETLLANVLPPNGFKMQYSFENGEIVDAAIYVRDRIVPIDAKFSLENYNRLMQENDEIKRTKLEKEFKQDIMKRIDETSKYIRPEENTTDFAIMFIPAEGIYYNMLIYKTGTVEINTQNLIEYAFKKRVMIVSPATFYAYLQTLLQGLKALEMEASVKDVIKKVGELSKHLNTYQTYMDKLGNHLGTTVSMYNNATSEFRKIDKDVIKISGGVNQVGYQLKELEKPQLNS